MWGWCGDCSAKSIRAVPCHAMHLPSPSHIFLTAVTPGEPTSRPYRAPETQQVTLPSKNVSLAERFNSSRRRCDWSRVVRASRRRHASWVWLLTGVNPYGWISALLRTKPPSEQLGIRIRWVEDSQAPSESALRCRPVATGRELTSKLATTSGRCWQTPHVPLDIGASTLALRRSSGR